MNVRRLLVSELHWANERYSEIDFVKSSESDFIAVAESETEKIGLGRIVPIENDTGELGGMYVLPSYRGRSAAAEIIQYLLKHSPCTRLFCIPFAHLDTFYKGFGFTEVHKGDEIPGVVMEKFKWCQGHYSDPVTLLVKHQG